MPLASNAPLSAHFTAWELGADLPTASGAVVANLRAMAASLEGFRSALGVPMRVTSGYRAPSDPLSIAIPTSDHPNGLAVDFAPVGLNQFTAYQRLAAAKAAGTLPPFDQLIFYPADGHIHVGFGPKMRRELRIELDEGKLAILSSDLVQKLKGHATGYVDPGILLGILILLFIIFATV